VQFLVGIGELADAGEAGRRITCSAVARRAACCAAVGSSAIRIEKISATWRPVGTTTRKPRLRVNRTSPASASARTPSRAGLRDTSSRSATCCTE
jgi:hypothetical protein